ncbi:DNA cytosine methyltransferase [Comamonas antarctica]|uniref:DNA (cytosine-5-)-methyltransferase n=1 Tax=Comamonas antarctica TaxID=2743470 RepID=A0A6N1WZN9_9BURK|nr:DNA cytosine methyltransferase [Comamonas antarctica]QKV52619.1 DNA cytosine methyltransferase [Comamonas antarctica]
MRRDDFTLPLAFPGELIIDNFAGGGGTSTGLEAAFGRPVDIAINHDPQALAMHALNHPHTQHLCESVWEVDPIKVTRNQPVALVWLSPDCKHFSKAKGGTPVAKHIRGLAWVGMRWIALCKPRVLMLENVEEFQDWGPLIIDADGNARPCPHRKGKTFESFVRQLRAHGYTVDWRELRACDYGAPTIRKRLFLIARRDGLPIVWPEASHAEPANRAVLAGKLAAHRSAAECIDFDLPAESVFGRKKPLVPNTMRRVAKGLWRHVLTTASPFIVGVGGRMGQSPERSVRTPMQTITSKADSCVAMPILAALRGTSEQHLSSHDVCAPLSIVSAGGTHHALAGAHLVTIGYGEREGQAARAQDLSLPLGTVVAGGVKSALVAACLEQANGGFYEGDGRAADDPMSTITAAGSNQRLVAAYLVKYYSEGGQDSACSEPMHTVPTKARMGLVQTQQVPAALLSDDQRERARLCAELLHQHLPEHFPEAAALVLMWHAEQWWVLVDITLRMLKPRELYRAQGFPEGYQITEIPDPALLFVDGQQAAHPLDLPRIPLTATAQVRMCGNSVSPPVAEALAAANFAHEALIYGTAAA